MRDRLKAFIEANTEIVDGKPMFEFCSNTSINHVQKFYVNDKNTTFKVVDRITIGSGDAEFSVICTFESFVNGNASYKIVSETWEN